MSIQGMLFFLHRLVAARQAITFALYWLQLSKPGFGRIDSFDWRISVCQYCNRCLTMKTKERVRAQKLFVEKMKKPKEMQKFFAYLDQRISKLEKRRLKGFPISEQTVFLLDVFLTSCSFFLVSPHYGKSIRQKHASLTKRLARFFYR